jgi:YidC/Oxa1 family membrane protein insertase
MFNIVLSCTNFPVIGPLIEFLAQIMSQIMIWIYQFFDMLNIANVGLCIIALTFIVKLIMMPLTFKQQKFSKISSIMNPEIMEIQKKYKGRRDAEASMAMQAETKAVYEKYGTSPTGGCLQVVIQMPILLALYQVILHINDYVPAGVSETFLGIDLSKTPWSMLGLSIIIPILSGAAQWLSAKLMQGRQTISEDNPMAASMRTMTFTMPVVSAVFCFTVPAGVGLYWVASSVFQVLSQIIVNHHLDRMDLDELIRKNVEKANKKRNKKNERKGMPTTSKVNNAARYNTKNIPQPKEASSEKKGENTNNSNTNSKQTYKTGSLSAKANMVKELDNKNKKK